MKKFFIVFFVIFALLTTTQVLAQGVNPDSDESSSELTERGRNVKALYIPPNLLNKFKDNPSGLALFVQDIGANAVVIDFKNDMGDVVPEDRILPFITAFKSMEIYSIARIVCFKDRRFAKKAERQSSAIKKAFERMGIHFTVRTFQDKDGKRWVDPGSKEMRQYLVDTAVKAEELGFDEIQFDYVRYPSDWPKKWIHPKNRYRNIAALLRDTDIAVHIPISIDTFGCSSLNDKTAQTLGQVLPFLARYLDAISPMVYHANWDDKTRKAGMEAGLKKLRQTLLRTQTKLGTNKVVIRPYLQAFSFRAGAFFGSNFIKQQIKSAEMAGARGYILWNAGGRYKKTKEALKPSD